MLIILVCVLLANDLHVEVTDARCLVDDLSIICFFYGLNHYIVPYF